MLMRLLRPHMSARTVQRRVAATVAGAGRAVAKGP